MRATLNASLPDTATILRRTLVPNGRGQQSVTYTAAGTTACRLAPSGRPRSTDVPAAESTRQAEEFIVTLPCGAGVEETDRLLVGGVTYTITSAVIERSQALCQRITVQRV